MKTYLDTNVLLFAFADKQHPLQVKARQAIYDCAEESRIVTSFLTIDEFIWALRRVVDYPTAVNAAFEALELPMEIVPIGEKEGVRALTLMQDPGLRPHDATHAGVALQNGCSRILSTDPDFDAVPGLERHGLDS